MIYEQERSESHPSHVIDDVGGVTFRTFPSRLLTAYHWDCRHSFLSNPLPCALLIGIMCQPMYSGVLCVDTPSRRRESPIVDTQPTSADAGDSAAFDTPADVGWVRMSRR